MAKESATLPFFTVSIIALTKDATPVKIPISEAATKIARFIQVIAKYLPTIAIHEPNCPSGPAPTRDTSFHCVFTVERFVIPP
ncbi:hypothetical protein K4I03_2339 [Streptococcus sanguinis]|nr:hypothetical protein [Streptococcus sanguinis]